MNRASDYQNQAINGANIRDSLIEGNYVNGAVFGFYGDTGSYENVIVVHNVFENCQTPVNPGLPAQNLTFCYNTLSTTSNDIYRAFWFTGTSYTNIAIIGNTVTYNGLQPSPDSQFLYISNMVTGLFVANNRAEINLSSTLSGSTGLNIFNNVDEFGNPLTGLNQITTANGVLTVKGTTLTDSTGKLVSSSLNSPSLTTLSTLNPTSGNLIYGAGSSWTTLPTSPLATRYLANTGAGNQPAWSQVNLANGVTGTLSDMQLSTNVALLNGNQTFTGVNSFSNQVVVGGTVTAGSLRLMPTNGLAYGAGSQSVYSDGGADTIYNDAGHWSTIWKFRENSTNGWMERLVLNAMANDTSLALNDQFGTTYTVLSSATSGVSFFAGKLAVGKQSANSTLDVNGTATVTGLTMTTGAAQGKSLQCDSSGNASWGDALQETTEGTNTPVVDNISMAAGGTTNRLFQFFTLPITEKLYVITGIEWKNGSTVAGSTICGAVFVDGIPPTNPAVPTVAFGQLTANSGTNATQRVSQIVCQPIRGGTPIGIFVQSSTNSQTYRALSTNSINNRKTGITFPTGGDVANQENNAWVANTTNIYLKVYYRGYK
jgi:hypothetical protein